MLPHLRGVCTQKRRNHSVFVCGVCGCSQYCCTRDARCGLNDMQLTLRITSGPHAEVERERGDRLTREKGKQKKNLCTFVSVSSQHTLQSYTALYTVCEIIKHVRLFVHVRTGLWIIHIQKNIGCGKLCNSALSAYAGGDCVKMRYMRCPEYTTAMNG